MWIAIIIISIILVLLVIAYFIVRNLARKYHDKTFNYHQYQDSRIRSYTLEDFNLETKEFETTDTNRNLKIRGYFYTTKGKDYDKSKLVIFCHGLWSTAEAYIQDIGYIANQGYEVLCAEYIGVGRSDGDIQYGFGNAISSTDFVIKAIKQDPNYKDKDLYVIGHSLGGFVATNIIKYHPDIKGVVGEAPMPSIVEVLVGLKTPKPIAKMIEKYDRKLCGDYALCNSLESLKNYNGKAYIIQSDDDNMIAYDKTFKVLEECLKDKPNFKFVTVHNLKHNPVYEEDAVKLLYEYYDKFKEFSSKKDEMDEFLKLADFKKAGKIDAAIMNDALEILK